MNATAVISLIAPIIGAIGACTGLFSLFIRIQAHDIKSTYRLQTIEIASRVQEVADRREVMEKAAELGMVTQADIEAVR